MNLKTIFIIWLKISLRIMIQTIFYWILKNKWKTFKIRIIFWLVLMAFSYLGSSHLLGFWNFFMDHLVVLMNAFVIVGQKLFIFLVIIVIAVTFAFVANIEKNKYKKNKLLIKNKMLNNKKKKKKKKQQR